MALYLQSYYTKIIAEQKYSIPLLNVLVLKMAMKNGCEDYYANSQSVIEYPRYLFREDIRQKWTNERTVNNICVVPCDISVDGEELYTANGFNVYDFTYKSDLMNRLLVYQKSLLDSAFLEKNSQKLLFVLKEHIRFFDMVVEDNFDYNDIINVMLDLKTTHKNVVPICAVYHQDENYKHVHFLYLIDPSCSLGKRELKKIPHIEQIIKGKYDTCEKE